MKTNGNTAGSKHKVVTLREVAEAAGVSTSTVSRVLDDRMPPSHSPTAQRVREVAAALGYRRNTFASSLRRGQTATIGVLVPRLSDTVMALMYEAVGRAAKRLGYFTMVATTGDDPAEVQDAAHSLLSRNVDGLIISSSRRHDPLPQQLREQHVPHALVLRTDGISPSSVGDDEAGGYLATRHLIDLGHTDIAVLSGPLFTSTATGRLAGARKALREAGIESNPDWIIETGFGTESGAEAGEKLFAASARPTAVFAANDNLALGVMAAAHRYSLTIGTDIALVGYNDIPLSQHLPIPLTSVRTSFDQIAATALDLMLATTDDPHPIRKALPTLIPRQSSGSHSSVGIRF
ncbi:transcriptional regulator, LacI family [Rhodococcus rhodochrous J3]|uniref:Transcriptional regulator, LacI family n=1 Tax=Rhodococcus rhodochrous J3 TaxID=903528 RepID=A0ABY1MJS7_RHORH|nr:LacI family DNA-binding transcriptional regulator [Rhodococcus rhodochrous]MBF4477187.1 LacI family DNA-binding transcriptional regulator [Rhodococcus rhodochrous]TWH41162.1 LacI family transcriptional regulator [Rhodococcus rhodochrous J38]SMG60127.1 transcriptional regulator, LacI family [Rhodococcus rhodochrous J3]